MYADFESILMPIQCPSPDPNEPYTSKVSQHIPSGCCVYSKFSYGDVKDPLTIYRGEDCERGSAITLCMKPAGCTTCFLKNPWIL